ncbi:hypothetical protein [Flammeovirga sp. OC4]|uniref:hypothetical protein n=1 Tax=Flammeovirga sp. OC4 TaxID=1382345 RepID=UPI0005C65361|nr:hypothetical protein [Flammeovirga sp. OC4]
MNLSVKLILASLLLTSLFSCTSATDEIFPEVSNSNRLPRVDSSPQNAFLTIELVPNGDVCNNSIIANVELISSTGFEFKQNIQARDGVLTFSLDNNFVGGSYAVTFKTIDDEELIGSTSFYLTSDDLKKEYYTKTVEYSNCNF